ncbi:MAG: hypothetical protein KDI47_14910 [Gammaproteobacteria bacterium]|nr:hypothetical protein [Gammaproteobacteria bacterium]MCB1880666.1 hypothetical protein [Gammaproteobacteria bacterium]MCB1904887.1 hypothetical protein [Gammaproteobacteria bacterium]
MNVGNNSIAAIPKQKSSLSGWMVPLLMVAALSTPLAAADQNPAFAIGAEQVAPLRDLLAQLSENYPGRVLEVELEREAVGREDIWVYEVKLLTDRGRVLKLEYDAVSLELLKVKGKAGDGF